MCLAALPLPVRFWDGSVLPAGGTMPAGLPEQISPAQPATQPTTAPPAAPTSTQGSGMGGMGMMPMNRGHGGGAGKELPRNAEWFPDEQLIWLARSSVAIRLRMSCQLPLGPAS